MLYYMETTLSLLTWLMGHIMNPTLTLLNSDTPPLRFRHEMSFWDQFYQFFG
jgi:hypothetical protein